MGRFFYTLILIFNFIMKTPVNVLLLVASASFTYGTIEQGIGISYFGANQGDKNNLHAGLSRTEGNLTLTVGPGANKTYANNADTIAGTFVPASIYEIKTVGTTDFTLIGAGNNDVGTIFVATDVGSGDGVASKILTMGWDGYGITTNNLVGMNDTTFGSSSDYITSDSATTYSALKIANSDNQFKLDLSLTNNGSTDVVLKDLYFDARNAFGANHRDTIKVAYVAGDLIKGTGYANDSNGNSTIGNLVFASTDKILYTSTWTSTGTTQVRRGFGALGGETILPAGGSMTLRFSYPSSGIRGTGQGQQQLDNILITVVGPDLDSALFNTGETLGLNATEAEAGSNGVSFDVQYGDGGGDPPAATYTLDEIIDLRAGSSMIEVVNGVATVELEVEESTDLENWTSGGTATININADAGAKFFRFKIAD